MSGPDLKDIRALNQLCHHGKLYEVEEWIKQGKPVNPPEDYAGRKTPLQIAIERGFHSLVKILVINGADLYDPFSALDFAVQKNNFEIAKLLVEHGADIKSVPFDNVLLSYNPDMMRYFVEHGADLITDDPFATAFKCKVRTMLGVYKECRRRLPELQNQADIALHDFCQSGNEKWINLMLWVGANPHAQVQVPNSDPGSMQSPVEACCLRGDIKFLEKMQVDPAKCNMSDLLWTAVASASAEVIEFLIQKGAIPNNQPNGGSEALDFALHCLHWDSTSTLSSVYHPPDAYPSRRMDVVELLLKRGAKWMTEDAHSVASVRRRLLELDSRCMFELIRLLNQYQAAEPSMLYDLVRTSSAKNHLEAYWDKVMRLVPGLKPSKKDTAAVRRPSYSVPSR